MPSAFSFCIFLTVLRILKVTSLFPSSHHEHGREQYKVYAKTVKSDTRDNKTDTVDIVLIEGDVVTH
jgi:hypothetical protein